MVRYIYRGFKKLWLKILKLYSKGKDKKARKLEFKLNKKIAKRHK